MLGLASWFIGVSAPVVGGILYVATRKRLSLQWREELMDPACSAFPPLHRNDLLHFRTVAAEGRESETLEKSVGLRVCGGLAEDEAAMLLDHVRSWAAKYGNPFDDRIISFWEQQCAKVTLDVHHSVNVDASTTTSLSPLLPKKNLLVSDHAEDVQGCKAPWGTGDRIDFAEMPAVMRHLVNRVQADLDHACGRLRHVYIEYSPSGQYFHKPTATKAFDGHEYVVIPLRNRKSDTVVTFSPSMRSRSTDIQEVLTQSWSSRDLDALVPNGRFLRVYGQARYDYSWSVRPGASSWFGVPSNVVSSRQEEKTTSSSSTTSLSGFSWRTLLFGAPRRGSSPLASTTHQEPVDDAALVVLHFEGPRAQGKKRSLLLHPESLIFGSKPEPSTFERWNDEMPTAKDVWDDWVVLFVAKNYLNILRLS